MKFYLVELVSKLVVFMVLKTFTYKMIYWKLNQVFNYLYRGNNHNVMHFSITELEKA